MDGSGAASGQPIVPPQQQAQLIRTDQVQKLPHLNDQQKAQHAQLVRQLWEILNSRDPQSAEYQNAQLRLTQLSQNLMKGMRLFQQNRQQQALQQQQAQAAVAAQQGQPVQRPQAANPQSFNQLLPQIQQKVNTLHFFFPPNISKEQTQTWLPEARLRYGIALQKQEIGRARMNELRQQFAQRQSAGNVTQEEMQEFKNRQMAAEKLFREGSDFLNKFKEQQESFKAQQQNQPTNRPAAPNAPIQGQPQQAGPDQTQGATGEAQAQAQAQAQAHVQAQTQAAQVQSQAQAAQAQAQAQAQASQARPANAPAQMHPGQTQPPAAHTVNSAVNAARHQAGQAAMSPSTSQPGQTPTSQGQAQTATPQPGQMGTQPGFHQTPGPQAENTPTPGSVSQQPPNQQGPPRPLSHKAAMAQAAQNYTNYNNQQQQQQQQPQNGAQSAANTHAHPQYINNRPPEANTRNVNMAIPKNLNVPPPEPVSMGPARPTLSGGPSHGAMGMMGQPAIQKHPGYVLEGEGQRVLSKKMLDTLVRQVTGGGEGEGLTPDAEEVRLISLSTRTPTFFDIN